MNVRRAFLRSPFLHQRTSHTKILQKQKHKRRSVSDEANECNP